MRPGWFAPRLQRLRREDWSSLVLLLAAFTVLVLGAAGTVRGLEFGLLWPPVLLALALGWGLAALPVPGWLAAPLCLLTGTAVVTIRVGVLGPPLARLLASLFALIWQAITRSEGLPAASLPGAWDELAGAVGVLVARLGDWLAAQVRGEPAFDPLATAVLWLLLLFGTAVWAAWAVRRHNRPVPGLLPALLLLGAILATTGGPAFFLAPPLALALVLQATISHKLRERSWLAGEIDYPSRAGRNVTWTATGLAVALMVVALIVPSLSIYRLVDYVRDLSQGRQGNDVARSLGLDVPSAAVAADVFAGLRFGGLPTSHLIGSGPELSQQPVMAITVEGAARAAGQPPYWRGLVYDRYTGRGWETRGTATIAYEAGQPAGLLPPNTRPVRQEVRPLADLGGLLYTAGALVTVDQDFQVAWRMRYRGTETYMDFFAATMAGGDTGSDAAHYRADSAVPTFDEAGLRAAVGEIPAWINERYLALPEVVPERVLSLARDLTATGPTPYDRALAIETYLRQFPYTLDLPAPPAGREIAAYFLFELQRGYCDYYATTMVVLARAAGLPARLATGYVGGEYDRETGRYLVTADLVHSWPEIYFSGYGWVPFEPTAGRAAIERPAVAQAQGEPGVEQELEPITAARDRARWNRAVRTVAIIIAGLLVTGITATLGWWVLDLRRLHFLPPDRAVYRLFGQLVRSGRRLGVPPGPGETPHEFAGRLGARLVALSQRKRGLASTPEAIAWLTHLYTRSLYSPYRPEEQQRAQAIQSWSRLRLQLLWAALLIRGDKLAGRGP